MLRRKRHRNYITSYAGPRRLVNYRVGSCGFDVSVAGTKKPPFNGHRSYVRWHYGTFYDPDLVFSVVTKPKEPKSIREIFLDYFSV